MPATDFIPHPAMAAVPVLPTGQHVVEAASTKAAAKIAAVTAESFNLSADGATGDGSSLMHESTCIIEAFSRRRLPMAPDTSSPMQAKPASPCQAEQERPSRPTSTGSRLPTSPATAPLATASRLIPPLVTLPPPVSTPHLLAAASAPFPPCGNLKTAEFGSPPLPQVVEKPGSPFNLPPSAITQDLEGSHPPFPVPAQDLEDGQPPIIISGATVEKAAHVPPAQASALTDPKLELVPAPALPPDGQALRNSSGGGGAGSGSSGRRPKVTPPEELLQLLQLHAERLQEVAAAASAADVPAYTCSQEAVAAALEAPTRTPIPLDAAVSPAGQSDPHLVLPDPPATAALLLPMAASTSGHVLPQLQLEQQQEEQQQEEEEQQHQEEQQQLQKIQQQQEQQQQQQQQEQQQEEEEKQHQEEQQQLQEIQQEQQQQQQQEQQPQQQHASKMTQESSKALKPPPPPPSPAEPAPSSPPVAVAALKPLAPPPSMEPSAGIRGHKPVAACVGTLMLPGMDGAAGTWMCTSGDGACPGTWQRLSTGAAMQAAAAAAVAPKPMPSMRNSQLKHGSPAHGQCLGEAKFSASESCVVSSPGGEEDGGGGRGTGAAAAAPAAAVAPAATVDASRALPFDASGSMNGGMTGADADCVGAAADGEGRGPVMAVRGQGAFEKHIARIKAVAPPLSPATTAAPPTGHSIAGAGSPRPKHERSVSRDRSRGTGSGVAGSAAGLGFNPRGPEAAVARGSESPLRSVLQQLRVRRQAVGTQSPQQAQAVVQLSQPLRPRPASAPWAGGARSSLSLQGTSRPPASPRPSRSATPSAPRCSNTALGASATTPKQAKKSETTPATAAARRSPSPAGSGVGSRIPSVASPRPSNLPSPAVGGSNLRSGSTVATASEGASSRASSAERAPRAVSAPRMHSPQPPDSAPRQRSPQPPDSITRVQARIASARAQSPSASLGWSLAREDPTGAMWRPDSCLSKAKEASFAAMPRTAPRRAARPQSPQAHGAGGSGDGSGGGKFWTPQTAGRQAVSGGSPMRRSSAAVAAKGRAVHCLFEDGGVSAGAVRDSGSGSSKRAAAAADARQGGMRTPGNVNPIPNNMEVQALPGGGQTGPEPYDATASGAAGREEFLARQQALLERRRVCTEKQNCAREAEVREEMTGKPAISLLAAGLHRTVADLEAWGRRKEAHLELARRHRHQLELQAEAAGVTFRPEINEKSRKIAGALQQQQAAAGVSAGGASLPLSFSMAAAAVAQRVARQQSQVVAAGSLPSQFSSTATAQTEAPPAGQGYTAAAIKARARISEPAVLPTPAVADPVAEAAAAALAAAASEPPMRKAMDQLHSVKQALADGWLTEEEAQAYYQQYMQAKSYIDAAKDAADAAARAADESAASGPHDDSRRSPMQTAPAAPLHHAPSAMQTATTAPLQCAPSIVSMDNFTATSHFCTSLASCSEGSGSGDVAAESHPPASPAFLCVGKEELRPQPACSPIASKDAAAFYCSAIVSAAPLAHNHAVATQELDSASGALLITAASMAAAASWEYASQALYCLSSLMGDMEGAARRKLEVRRGNDRGADVNGSPPLARGGNGTWLDEDSAAEVASLASVYAGSFCRLDTCLELDPDDRMGDKIYVRGSSSPRNRKSRKRSGTRTSGARAASPSICTTRRSSGGASRATGGDVAGSESNGGASTAGASFGGDSASGDAAHNAMLASHRETAILVPVTMRGLASAAYMHYLGAASASPRGSAWPGIGAMESKAEVVSGAHQQREQSPGMTTAAAAAVAALAAGILGGGGAAAAGGSSHRRLREAAALMNQPDVCTAAAAASTGRARQSDIALSAVQNAALCDLIERELEELVRPHLNSSQPKRRVPRAAPPGVGINRDMVTPAASPRLGPAPPSSPAPKGSPPYQRASTLQALLAMQTSPPYERASSVHALLAMPGSGAGGSPIRLLGTVPPANSRNSCGGGGAVSIPSTMAELLRPAQRPALPPGIVAAAAAAMLSSAHARLEQWQPGPVLTGGVAVMPSPPKCSAPLGRSGRPVRHSAAATGKQAVVAVGNLPAAAAATAVAVVSLPWELPASAPSRLQQQQQLGPGYLDPGSESEGMLSDTEAGGAPGEESPHALPATAASAGDASFLKGAAMAMANLKALAPQAPALSSVSAMPATSGDAPFLKGAAMVMATLKVPELQVPTMGMQPELCPRHPQPEGDLEALPEPSVPCPAALHELNNGQAAEAGVDDVLMSIFVHGADKAAPAAQGLLPAEPGGGRVSRDKVTRTEKDEWLADLLLGPHSSPRLSLAAGVQALLHKASLGVEEEKGEEEAMSTAGSVAVTPPASRSGSMAVPPRTAGSRAMTPSAVGVESIVYQNGLEAYENACVDRSTDAATAADPTGRCAKEGSPRSPKRMLHANPVYGLSRYTLSQPSSPTGNYCGHQTLVQMAAAAVATIHADAGEGEALAEAGQGDVSWEVSPQQQVVAGRVCSHGSGGRVAAAVMEMLVPMVCNPMAESYRS